jgi:hypothetical protein
LLDHLHRAEGAYRLALSDDGRWLLVQNYVLPAGYNAATTQVLVCIPPDYPLRPPGLLPHAAYIAPGLLYHGQVPYNVVERQGPGWGQWSWLCIVRIDWNPQRDDLVRVLEMIRTFLSYPTGA